MRQVAEGPISAGRQWKVPSGFSGASREEAPEEMIFMERDAARRFLRKLESEAGRDRGHPKKGRGTSAKMPCGRLKRWEATPELVSLDL
jgi:hypothetical protein